MPKTPHADDSGAFAIGTAIILHCTKAEDRALATPAADAMFRGAQPAFVSAPLITGRDLAAEAVSFGPDVVVEA